MLRAEQPTTAQLKQTLNLIWLMLTAAISIYWYVSNLVGGKGPQAGGDVFLIVLIGLGVVETIGAWVYAQMTVKAVATQLEVSRAGAISTQARTELENRLVTTGIICCALFEAIAVYGLVAALIGTSLPHAFEYFACFSLANLVALRLSVYPRFFDFLDQLAQRHARSA